MCIHFLPIDFRNFRRINVNIYKFNKYTKNTRILHILLFNFYTHQQIMKMGILGLSLQLKHVQF